MISNIENDIIVLLKNYNNSLHKLNVHKFLYLISVIYPFYSEKDDNYFAENYNFKITLASVYSDEVDLAIKSLCSDGTLLEHLMITYHWNVL